MPGLISYKQLITLVAIFAITCGFSEAGANVEKIRGKFYSKYANLDSTMVARVDAYLEDAIEESKSSQFYSKKGNLAVYLPESSRRNFLNTLYEEAYHTLAHLSENDPEHEYLTSNVDDRMVEKLFKRYYVDSCSYYVNNLKSVMNPVIDGVIDELIQTTDTAFYNALTKFALCKSVIKKYDDLAQGIADFARESAS